MKLSPRARLNAALAIVLLAFTAIGTAAYRSTLGFIAAAEGEMRSRRIMEALDHVLGEMRDIETGSRGYLLTGDESYLEPFLLSRNRVDVELDELRLHTVGRPEYQAPIAALDSLVAAKLSWQEGVNRVRREDGLEPSVRAIATGDGKQMMDRIRIIVKRIEQQEIAVLARHEAVSREGGWRALRVIHVSMVGVVLLLGFGAYRANADLTARERADRALRASNQTLQSLIESAPLAIFSLDREGRLTSWNPAAERIFGWSGEEVIGLPLPCVPPENAEEHLAFRERAFRGEAVTALDLERCRKDGSVIHIDVSTAPLWGADGSVTGIMSIAQDVTERRRWESTLRESEERFRSALEHAPIGIALVGTAGSWLKVNRALCDLVGYSEKELLNLTFQDITHPEDLETDLSYAQRLLRREIPSYQMEKRYIHKDGHIVWILLTASLVFDERGAPLHFIAHIQGITERKRAEELLVETARHLATVVELQQEIATAGLETQRVMQTVVDRVLGFVGAEGAVVELVEGDIVVYRAASGTLAPHVGMRLPVDQSISGHAISSGETLVCDDSAHDPRVNQEAWRRVGARSMVVVPLNVPGIPAGVLKVVSSRPRAFGEREAHSVAILARLVGASIRDALAFENEQALLAASVRAETEIAQQAAELGRLNEKLERSNRELQEFAYVASHDLQEPLRKIQAFGDRLQTRFADSLGDQGRDYVERMQSAAGRMQALVRDLLSLSRVATQQEPFVPVDLGKVVREVVSDLDARIDGSGARVELGDLPHVEGDPTQMRQLFQNLIGNALKYRRPEVAPLVRLRAERQGAFFRIEVEDNGIGLDEQYAERIFLPFQRLHGRGEYEGTGMGLAISRKIVERHGGSIQVRSTPGEGSTFTVAIPAAVGAATHDHHSG